MSYKRSPGWTPRKVRQVISLALIVVGFLGLANRWHDTASGPGSDGSSDTLAVPPAAHSPGRSIRTDSARPVRCKVLTVYDGDTLGCDLNGNGRIRRPGEMVRMLGIDAPEMHWSKKNKTGRDQPGALEALQFVERAVKGKTVTLAWDKRRIDKYGRNLAFVYPDDAGGRSTAATSLNEQLVARGLAACLFIGQNRKLEDRFYALQAQAREAGRGVWAQSSL